MLTIISIIVSIIFGIVGVWSLLFAYRQKQYPGRISLVKEGFIGLFDEIIRNQEKLSILYDGSPIGQNLILLKGILLNSGTIDITKNMTKDGPLTFELPVGFKWIDQKVISSSEGLNVQLSKLDDRHLRIDFVSTFRREEYIRFEALAEVPLSYADETNGKDTDAATILQKKITFKHRIDNTKKEIDTQGYDKPQPFKSLLLKEKPMLFFVFLILISSFLLLVLYYFTPTEYAINYIIQSKDGQNTEVKIKAIEKDKVEITNIEDDSKEVVPIDEFSEF